MKRLITILISFIGCVSLFGQQRVPVLVAGNVYVQAPFRSEGAVHVYADSTDLLKTGKITIADVQNSVLGADTIILHSTHISDGLLTNLKPDGVKERRLDVAAPGAPKAVIIRKRFREGTWTYMSFPFDVARNDVKRGATDDVLLAGGGGSDGYWAAIFDAKGRKESGYKNNSANWYDGFGNVKGTSNWLQLDEISGAYSAGFSKGVGYLLWYENGTNGHKGGDVDFLTSDQTAIKNLFSLAEKEIKFQIYGSDTIPGAYAALGQEHEWRYKSHDDVALGWAFLGGLYPTAFNYNKNTVDYVGTIYYRGATTSHTVRQMYNAYESKYLLDPTATAHIGPYTPFYVQYAPTTFGSLPQDTTFKYKQGTAGLTHESAVFRSVQGERKIKDMLYFELSSKRNNTSDKFYLTFSDGYSDSYRGIEDAGAMLPDFSSPDLTWTSEDSPLAWTIDGSSRQLFVNGLPSLKDEQRVVKLGFFVPEAGDYQFTMDTRYKEDVKEVILEDRVAKKEVNLLQTPYSFSSEALAYPNSDRFVLYINRAYTDIPTVESGQPYAFVKDNLLTIKNLAEGDKILVYDLAGRAIVSNKVSGKEFSTVLGQKGVYIVSVQAKTGQTSTLKVLNK